MYRYTDWCISACTQVHAEADKTDLHNRTLSVISQEGIIEIRNTLSKINSQDAAPGILIFSDLLNLLKLLAHYSFRKARSYMILTVRDTVIARNLEVIAFNSRSNYYCSRKHKEIYCTVVVVRNFAYESIRIHKKMAGSGSKS
jgi:hypothetical protein